MKIITRINFLSAIVICLSLNVAEANAYGNCRAIYKNIYLKAKKSKAFAMSEPLSSLNSRTEIACGANTDNSSLADAKKRALRNCNGVKKAKTVPGKCRIVDSK